MYKEHPVFEKPTHKGAKIWRYMDVIKYISLVQTSSLFFCRADFLKSEDPFEGTLPRRESEYLSRTGNEGVRSYLIEKMPKEVYVSCWHLSEIESIAMWKLYSEAEKGIAIQTTFERFTSSLQSINEDIFAGLVQYVDYENDTFYAHSSHKFSAANVFTAFIHKRNIYSHEKEFRAIYSASGADDRNGIGFKIDLRTLVERVVVSPSIPSWVFDLIDNLTKQYVQDLVIEQSVFDAKPFS